jgi:ribonuclease P protein component
VPKRNTRDTPLRAAWFFCRTSIVTFGLQHSPGVGHATLGDFKVGDMERLKRRSDFRAVAQAAGQGARAHANAFVLQARPRAPAGPPRIGFTVAKQVGNAVERNRVRRRLRELVRLAPPAALCAGHDYVLIGRRAALKAPFGDMMKELSGALRRVHASSAAGAATGASDDRPPHRAGSSSRPPRQTPKPDKPQTDKYEHCKYEH